MTILQLVAAVLLLGGNAYFVAVEFAVTRARPTMVAELVEQGASGARSLAHAVKNIDTYLSACQLGITVCSIGLGITAEPLVTRALEQAFGGGTLLGMAAATIAFVLAYGLVSMFHVVLGELAPKSLAIARTSAVGLMLLPPMRVFYVATKPVVDLFNWLGNLVLRPFGIPPASEAQGDAHSEDELRALMAESVRRGVLEPEEQAFAVGAFTFGDRRAHEIMVPRRSVTTAAADLDVRAIAAIAAESGHRRLLLVERDGDLDTPLGVLNLTDIAGALVRGEDADPRALARPLLETSEAALLDDLLEQLRDRRQRIALVRDEYGTALGIVSLEDILEQVVGDLRDEFDPRVEPALERVDGGVRVTGDAHVHYVAQKLGIDFGRHREATVGGLVTERLGHPPEPGEELEAGGARLRVLDVEGIRVAAVEITRDGGGPPP